MVTFAMGLTIPEHEMETCSELTKPAFIVLALTNDIFSWEKEYQDAQACASDHVVNAIWVAMKEYSVSVDKAKEVCAQRVLEAAENYQRVVQEHLSNEALSVDLRRYLDALQYSLAGNAAWSMLCPRYHHKDGERNISDSLADPVSNIWANLVFSGYGWVGSKLYAATGALGRLCVSIRA